MTEEEQIKENEAKAAEKLAKEEKRFALAKAIRKYHDADQKLTSARSEYHEAISDLNELMEPNSKFIIELNWVTHLFTCDNKGDFDIQQIDKIN
jgi:hypothetical protein